MHIDWVDVGIFATGYVVLYLLLGVIGLIVLTLTR